MNTSLATARTAESTHAVPKTPFQSSALAMSDRGWLAVTLLAEVPQGRLLAMKLAGKSLILSRIGSAVADTANSRLLGWKYRSDMRSLHGAVADAVMAQHDFHSKGENRSYGLPTGDSVCWFYDIQVCGDTVAIADSGNNRVWLWRWQ